MKFQAKSYILVVAVLIAVSGCTSEPLETSTAEPNRMCQVPQPLEQMTISDFNTCAVYYKAQGELLEIFETQKKLQAPLTMHADPAVDESWLDLEISRLNDAYNFWYPHFQPEEITQIYWLMDTPEQLAWANSIFQPIQGEANNGQSINALNPSTCEAANSSDFAEVNWERKKVVKHNYITNTCADMSSDENAFRPVHEYTHLVQYSFNIPQNAPVWFTEGSADYFGQILGNAKISESKLNFHRQNFSNSIRNLASLSEEEWDAKIADLSSPNGDGWQAYAVGGYLTELLIGVFGFDKFVEFMATFKNGPNLLLGEKPASIGRFNKNFERTYGISTEIFYTAGYRYVKEISALYPPQ